MDFCRRLLKHSVTQSEKLSTAAVIYAHWAVIGGDFQQWAEPAALSKAARD